MRKLIFAIIALLATTSCRHTENEVFIISTNDMHGAIDRFARLATLVQHYRDSADNVVLVDAGDIWTGNPYVDRHALPGYPMIELMDSLGYDIAVIGNHSFDHGHEVLARNIKASTFPTIIANVVFPASDSLQPKPYGFINTGGIRLGFLALLATPTGGKPEASPEMVAPFGFSDPVATASRYKTLKDSCEVLIGLTHLGLAEDSALALRMPELQLIIGGHSHDVVRKAAVVNGVTITQTGKGLKYAGVTRIKLRDGKVTGITNRLVTLDSIAADPAVSRMVERYKDLPELNEVIGSAAETLDNNTLSNMFPDAIIYATGCDLAVANIGGVRQTSMPEGNITLGDIYYLEPFGNLLTRTSMTLADMKELILNKYNSQGKESHRKDIYPGGFTYTITTDGSDTALDVRFYDMKGRPMTDLGRTYSVGMSDFFNSYYDFPQKGIGVVCNGTLAGALAEYVKSRSPLKTDTTERITVEKL